MHEYQVLLKERVSEYKKKIELKRETEREKKRGDWEEITKSGEKKEVHLVRKYLREKLKEKS